MSNVLEFRPASAGKPALCSARQKAAAEVVIFPGIRYERMAEPPEPSPKPSRRGRGRARGAK